MMPTIYYPRCLATISVVFDGLGQADSATYIADVIPRSASVVLNSYKEADTFDLEFDGRILPFDPSLIRSMAVRLYFWAAESAADRSPPPADAEVLVGLVDDDELGMSSDGQTVSCSGRDYTALLIDPEWDSKKRVPAGRDLWETIEDIVGQYVTNQSGTTAPLEVVWEVEDDPPVVGTVHRKTKRKGVSVKHGTSVWDVIYNLALSHGYIVFVRGDQVVISEPRVQTERSLAEAPRVAYGRNLSELRVSRNFGKERVPQILATSRDPKTGRVFEATYPPSHKSPTSGIGTKKDERRRVTAPRGITDRATLERFARSYYDSIARDETAYQYTTKHLRDLGGKDLIQLRGGSPTYIEFDAFNRETMRQLGPEERRAHLLAIGYSEQLANFVAVHFDRLEQFTQPYYIREAKLAWSLGEGGGISIDVDATNYAYARREEAAAP